MPDNAEATDSAPVDEATTNEEETTKRKRKKRARFNPAEIEMAHTIKNLAPLGESIAYSALPSEVRKAVLPFAKLHLVDKELVECDYDEEHGLLKSIRIDPEVWEANESDLVVTTPVKPNYVRRPTNHPIWSDEKYKIKLLVAKPKNPKREATLGWHNWEHCYSDGMSTAQYLYNLDYPRNIIVTNKRGRKVYFNGPNAMFVRQDMIAGNIALVDSSLPESDPNYKVSVDSLTVSRIIEDDENEEMAESGMEG
jgi:hypothetical protein